MAQNLFFLRDLAQAFFLKKYYDYLEYYGLSHWINRLFYHQKCFYFNSIVDEKYIKTIRIFNFFSYLKPLLCKDKTCSESFQSNLLLGLSNRINNKSNRDKSGPLSFMFSDTVLALL